VSSQGRRERIALNESRFREINDRAKRDLGRLRHEPELFELVCECARVDCRAQVALRGGEYEAVRSDPLLFAIVPGHELPEAEDVVERHDRYAVVRKHENVRDIVEETDPRAGPGGW